MSYYECVFIARQELSTTQAEQLADQMVEILVNNGGEVKAREYWGLKNLAYRIKKNRKGHYTMFHMDAPSGAVIEMERNMGLSEDVLRHLTIRLDELPEVPSIMMQAKSDRGDRGVVPTGTVRHGSIVTTRAIPLGLSARPKLQPTTRQRPSQTHPDKGEPL